MYKIAISGKARSGKNTLANMILSELAAVKGKESIISETIAFADPIKEIILKMFPNAIADFLYGSSELRSLFIPDATNKDGGLLTYRQALIDIGMLGRSYNSNIWVNCFDKTFQQILHRNKVLASFDQEIEAVIVPDLRFEEELNYLKNNNFYLIKINKKDVTIINHASETVQDGFDLSVFDIVIDNNGTLNNLNQIVTDNIVPQIISRTSSV